MRTGWNRELRFQVRNGSKQYQRGRVEWLDSFLEMDDGVGVFH